MNSLSPIVRRIRKFGLLDGVKLISHKEVIRRINGIRRKKVGSTNNGSLEYWMSELGFRKKWIGGKRASDKRLWWVRE